VQKQVKMHIFKVNVQVYNTTTMAFQQQRYQYNNNEAIFILSSHHPVFKQMKAAPESQV